MNPSSCAKRLRSFRATLFRPCRIGRRIEPQHAEDDKDDGAYSDKEPDEGAPVLEGKTLKLDGK